MIKVQDWVASIPDGDKHVAYVGEGMSETREFCLCGEGWEAYRNWSFHLDMAFDPESITTRESRQVVQTHSHSSQMKEEAAVNTEESVTKETYTVENEEVLDYSLTDIASLEKRVGEDGIYLTWTVLRQHTVLPGKLWATLRAVDGTAQMVKKSAIMVFEVDAAICAVPAARPSISEMEQIEARVALAADNATYCADRAEAAVTQSLDNVYLSQAHAMESKAAKERAQEYAMVAEGMYQSAVNQAATAEEHKWAALDAAEQAQACVTQAQEQAAKAEEHRGQASNFANMAYEANNAAGQAAASAAVSAEGAANAVNKCSHYAVQCASYADSAEAVMQAVENAVYRRVNVRDYGATGDGVTDDRGAILAAFEAAKTMLPCEVYFPAGTYGISNGMYIKMPLGSGGLRVCGAGRDTTTIQYLDSFAQNGSGRNWYAIRIEPETTPASEEEYLHDISYTGLTVYDPNPCANAWHPDKGDPGKEETHGFDMCYVKRGSVTECQFITVGDEAIDIYACHDVVVMNNRCIGSPGAGTAGGAISIGDGSNGIIVIGNSVNGSALDETLEDGTVLQKTNFGIAVESLLIPVHNVVIANNVIRNVQGNGINLAATNDGAGIYNINIEGNVVQGCNNGIGDAGGYPKEGVSICNNTILDCTKLRDGMGNGVYLDNVGFLNVSVCNNTIRNTDMCGAYVNGVDSFIEGNAFESIGEEALYIVNSATIRDCTIKNTGVGAVSGAAAINCYGSAVYSVSGCRISGVRQAKGLLNPTEVVDTTIAFVDADGKAVTTNKVLDSDRLKRVVNCQLNGWTEIRVANALVEGVTLNSGQTWQPAIKVSANGVIITGCHITAPSGRNAIAEQSGFNGNLFANNVVNRPITVVGAQSLAVNNIDLRTVTA